MKKLIFLLAVILLSQMVVAQQQSDATLEETIEWLNKYSFSKKEEKTNRSWHLEKSELTIQNFNNTITFKTELYEHFKYFYSDGSLREDKGLKISAASYEPDFKLQEVKKIWTNPFDDLVILNFNLQNGKTASLIYWGEDMNLAKRVYKALKHLFSYYPQYKVIFEDKTELENKF
jgi:hypothetical protein